MAEPGALPSMEIHTEGPTSVLDARQRWGDAMHTHTHTVLTRTAAALSLCLSRAAVPVANHRAVERGSFMTLTLRHKEGRGVHFKQPEVRGDGNIRAEHTEHR